MKHILYYMNNFLLKKIMFCRVNINFWRGRVEGGHNGGEFFIDFFSCFTPFRTVLEVFYVYKKICGKINYLDGWGVPPPPPPVENSAFIIIFFKLEGGTFLVGISLRNT